MADQQDGGIVEALFQRDDQVDESAGDVADAFDAVGAVFGILAIHCPDVRVGRVRTLVVVTEKAFSQARFRVWGDVEVLPGQRCGFGGAQKVRMEDLVRRGQVPAGQSFVQLFLPLGRKAIALQTLFGGGHDQSHGIGLAVAVAHQQVVIAAAWKVVGLNV